jgi:hypothetical protein
MMLTINQRSSLALVPFFASLGILVVLCAPTSARGARHQTSQGPNLRPAEEPSAPRGREDGPSHYEFPIIYGSTRGTHFDRATPLTKKQRQVVAPDPEDERRYDSFLRRRDTGIVRLFPADEASGDGSTISARSGPRAEVWGAGAVLRDLRPTRYGDST